jgi:hypothetical protein
MAVVVALHRPAGEVNTDLQSASARISAVKTLMKLMAESGHCEAHCCDLLEMAREHLEIARDAIENSLRQQMVAIPD